LSELVAVLLQIWWISPTSSRNFNSKSQIERRHQLSS
jgi:hypothetical protein